MSRRFTIAASVVSLILCICLLPTFAQKGSGKKSQATVQKKQANLQKKIAKKMSAVPNKTGKKVQVPQVRNLSQEKGKLPANGPENDALYLTPHTYMRSTARLIPQTGKAVKFAVTAPVSTFTPAKSASIHDDKEMEGEEHETPDIILVDPNAKRDADAALMNTSNAPTVIPAPSLTFSGVNNIDNFNAFGGRVLPPDTNGDVGPNDYVQTVNLLVGIYDKTGVIRAGSPFKMSTLFAPLGGACAALDNGDPVALYDQLSDRWLITQFAVPNPFHQCIAISQTGNPTGAYYVYDFIMPGGKFNDYPHFGWGSDALYMTDHQFNAAGTAYLGAGVFAFDKAKLLAGDPSASFIYFDLQPLDPNLFGHLIPDADGMAPPEPGHTYVFHLLSTEGGYGLDGIQIFDFTYDFVNPLNSTFAERADSPLAVPSFDPGFNESGATIAGCTGGNSRDDFPQPLPANDCQRLDSVGNRLLHRVQSRNFGSHTDYVMNLSVDVTPTDATRFDYIAGVRVFKLRFEAGTFALQQAFTLSPDTDDRFMAAVAMDNGGNMAIGYTVTSTATMPAVRYAGVTDGGVYLGEGSITAGAGVQTNTASRWGDYSGMNVDPTDECTYWYTQEYYTATGELCGATTSNACWKTIVGKFNLGTGASCTTPATGTIDGQVTSLVGGTPIPGVVITATDTTSSGSVSATTDGAGNYSRNIAPGNYDLVASKPGYGTSAPVNVTVAASGTVTTNFALDPHGVLALGPVSFSDAAGNNNGLIDPNECISLTVQLNNVGPGDATNVVGTLSSDTSGVTIPAATASQTYSTITPGGNATNAIAYQVSVSPAFTCGTDIDLTLTVATDDGPFSFPITLSTSHSSSVSFSATGPVGIPDNNPTGASLPIVVSGVPSFTRVMVSVRMTHTWDGDMDVFLVGSDGTTTINLSDDNGGSGDNYGTDCPAGENDTTFDDNAATSITGGAAPFVGHFIPEQPLSTMNAQVANGTWTLHIVDDYAGDLGTIQCWTITFVNDQPCVDGGGVCAGSVPVLSLNSDTVSNDTNADGNVDSNECFDLNADLHNDGTATATGITGTISTSTPGVTILDGTASFADIAPGANGGSTTPFQLRTGIGYDCSQPIELTMDVTSGSSNYSFPVTIIPDAGNGAVTQFTYSGPPVPIPDNNAAGASATVNVSGISPANLFKVTATLHISHTFDGDLILQLIGPDSTVVPLAIGRGGANLGFGTDCPADGNDTTFDDDATTPIGAGTGTFVGSFIPDGSLADFQGIDPNGDWTLHVIDAGAVDTGNIECWSMTVQPIGCQDAGCVTCGTITLSPATLPDGTLGGTYNNTITASGGVGPYTFAVTSGTVPTGLTLNSDGTWSGTTDANGTFNFTVTATDSNGCTGSQAYTVNVTCPFMIFSPASLPDGTQGVAYSQTVTATNGVAPIVYSLSAGALPAGLTLNPSTGQISGTPTTLGTSTFTIGAVDANGCTGAQTYSITINFPCVTLVFSPATLPDGTVGVAYSQTVTATNGSAPITYSVSSGALPAGLSLNSANGDITGTPTTVETANFTISAVDNNGCTGSQAYSITIDSACVPLVFSPTTLPDGTVGTAYSQTVTATNGTAPITYSVSAGALPAGLSLDTSTGDITGTPTTVETANFTISAIDNDGCTGSQAYTVNIVASCLFCDEFDNNTVDAGWSYNHISDWSESGTLLSVNAPKKSYAIASVFAGCQLCSTATSLSTTDDSSKVSFYSSYIDKKHAMEALFKFGGNKIVLKQRNGSIVKKQAISFSLDANTTYTVTMTNDGTNVVLNVNGTDIATFATVGSLPLGTTGFQVVGDASFDYIHVN